PAARNGHRIARGADRAPDPPDRIPDGAFQGAPEGSSLPAWVVEARGTASATARLPQGAQVPALQECHRAVGDPEVKVPVIFPPFFPSRVSKIPADCGGTAAEE